MEYASPSSLDEAIGLLSQAGVDARPMAGGTDLLVQLRTGTRRPQLVVDLKQIPGLCGIDSGSQGFRIGAAVSGAEIGECLPLREAWPGVVEAAELIGSTQIQGRASLGGNLCNASPAADSVPAIIAAGAIANIVGPGGSREEPVENIVTGPGQTSLAHGELIVSFSFPAKQANSGDCYLRLTPRTEMVIAIVGAGVNLTLDDDGTCTAARISIGAVAPTPLLVEDAANTLIGTKVNDAALDAMVEAVRAACNPISDKRGTREYRIKTAGVITRRAALKALERAQAN